MQKHNCKNNQHLRKAFTLIELLIVIAIIGILFIVLISKVDFATDKAKATGVQTDFRSFQLALETVAREHQGFSSLVDEDYEKLEIAINKNLDNKLKINIDDAGIITMANGATDPWGIEYHGQYVTGDDGKDRGAVVMYSNGANLTFGSDATICNGTVTVSFENDDGRDDYSMVIVYSLSKGAGEINTITQGFVANEGTLQSGNVNTEVSMPIEPNKPSETMVLNGGLYKSGTNEKLYTWQELIDLNIITKTGMGTGTEDDPNRPSQTVIDFLCGDLYVPETISSLPKRAFYGCENLTGVYFARTERTSLGDYAFSGTKMENMVVNGPMSYGIAFNNAHVENIYYNNVDSLLKSSINTPGNDHHYLTPVNEDTNIYIEDELLEHLVVPDGYTAINNGLFYLYSKLKTVTLPESVTTIGRCSFRWCTNLESINLDNITSVGKYSFKNTTLEEVNLPNVTVIYAEAFMDCSKLLKVNIGSKITKLHFSSFGNAKEYFELYYDGDLDMWSNILYSPDKYTKSGVTNGSHYRLFFEGQEVKGVFEVPTYWTTTPNAVFSGVAGITGLKVHEELESIGNYSFYNTCIVDLNLGETLCTIGDYAFSYTPVKYLNIPDSLVTLGAWSFYYCEQMLEVNINESSQMTTMGDGAFRECELLESLFIPPLIKRLDAHNLVIYCNNLKEFVFSPNTQLEYLNVSFGFVDYVTVYLPDTVKTVKDLDINVNWNSEIVIGENSQLERIEGKMFDRYFGDLYIPKNLNYISESWSDFQFSPKVEIHPENQYFKYENRCLIDINNKRIIASNSGATVPTDGSVTAIGESAGYGGIRYIPKEITYVHCFAWWNAHGSVFDLVYEGTMEEWKSIVSGTSLYSINTITCSDGVLYGSR